MITSTKMQLWYPKQVVDARAGPGMKSMTKFKSKIKKSTENGHNEKIKKKKNFEREYSPTPSEEKSDGNEDVDMVEMDFLSEDGPSGGSSRTASPGGSDCEDSVANVTEKKMRNGRHKGLAKKLVKQEVEDDVSDFIDCNYWIREIICCGTIYRGRFGEILTDPRFLRPCNNQSQCQILADRTKDNHSSNNNTVLPVKSFSDSSSDSGYDESSNGALHSDVNNPTSVFYKNTGCGKVCTGLVDSRPPIITGLTN